MRIPAASDTGYGPVTLLVTGDLPKKKTIIFDSVMQMIQFNSVRFHSVQPTSHC